MSLSQAFRKLTEAGLLTALTPRPLSRHVPPQFRMDLHCAYHQGPGHETGRCTALRHAIQDLIDQSTQARISIWSLLTSSSTHSDTLIRALSQIKVKTTITLEGLIHMVTAGRATCIVFSYDDLPPEGSDHTRPPYILVGCSNLRVTYVILDNSSTLNVCLMATTIALGYAPSDFGPSTQTVRAYDSTRREVMSWGHSFFPSFKGDHDGQVITVQSVGDMFISSEPVLHISHSDDDLFFTGFTFDEVNTLEKEDFFQDFVAMSFDPHGNTTVLDMMRSMSYLPGIGLGRRQHEPSEFMAIPDHGVPLRLGFIPIEADYRYMVRLRKERSYRPIQMGSLGDLTLLRRSSFSVLSIGCNRMSLMTFYFPDEVDEHETFAKIGDMVDGVVPSNEYIDEMLAMIEGASNFVDPPLSFDVLSGFVSHFDDIHDSSFMDLSIFEYMPVSYDITLSAPSSPTSQIFDIGDEIAQHDLDDDSSSASDLDLIDKRVSPAIDDTKVVDFGIVDQPKDLRIGLDLSINEKDNLI
ncbi:hypothetical protein CK203_065042 [Vitis vinifera]|uniref:Uncharacterized protein n=1 Tax=Vitis vinifera TaxID=29760 RepID=A0A438G746_VITVI|nr:hypothetical protein CK203_065042 [Vitis vinifera]